MLEWLLDNKKENNMTQEEKELLLKDLCARLPYGVIVETTWAEQLTDVSGTIGTLRGGQIELFEDGDYSEIIPYLRPMSSMTEEEWEEYKKWTWDDFCLDTIDWLTILTIVI